MRGGGIITLETLVSSGEVSANWPTEASQALSFCLVC